MLVAPRNTIAFSRARALDGAGEMNRSNQRFSAPRASVSKTAPRKNAPYKNALTENYQRKSNLCP
jgi:hypothetical protein